MTITLWCLFVAGLLVAITKMPLVAAQKKSGGYDNANPRAQQANLTGWGARALAAHQNQLESFPYFAAGALVATVMKVDPVIAGWLSLTYIAARLAYMFLYISNIHALRSLVWFVGFGVSLALICSPAWAGV